MFKLEPTTPSASDSMRLSGHRDESGFTLIELLLVVALIAIAAGVATLALRDPHATQLEHEAARLTSLLESARAQARGAGLLVQWVPNQSASSADSDSPADFRFIGLPTAIQFPTRWLSTDTSAQVTGASALTLGPEPLIGAQQVVLRSGSQQLILSTDGLSPFKISDGESVPTPAR